MTKFKVGDRAIINNNATTKKYVGKTVTITYIDRDCVHTDIPSNHSFYGFSFYSESLTLIYRKKV